jgi:hypothetical protein
VRRRRDAAQTANIATPAPTAMKNLRMTGGSHKRSERGSSVRRSSALSSPQRSDLERFARPSFVTPYSFRNSVEFTGVFLRPSRTLAA